MGTLKKTVTMTVPMELTTESESGSFQLVCHKIPMAIHGSAADDANAVASEAMELATSFMLSHGMDATIAYLTKRGVDHSTSSEELQPRSEAIKFLTAGMTISRTLSASGA